MKPRERIILILGLVLMAAMTASLRYYRTHQRLGKPGVRAEAILGSSRMHLEIVTNATGFSFTELPPSELMTNALPKDTSFRQGTYQDAEGPIQTFVVMMGADRTSIHQPQFCLSGSGWDIDDARSELTKVRIQRTRPVDLPVMKLITRQTIERDGKRQNLSGVYVYWFVADNEVSAVHRGRMWSLGMHFLQKGELQRWAYITYFAPCLPGQEDRAFNRIQRLMNRTLPDFQLAWPVQTESAGVSR